MRGRCEEEGKWEGPIKQGLIQIRREHPLAGLLLKVCLVRKEGEGGKSCPMVERPAFMLVLEKNNVDTFTQDCISASSHEKVALNHTSLQRQMEATDNAALCNISNHHV